MTSIKMVGYILRTKREFYTRLDPLSFFTDTKFVQRYRLTKSVVRILIQRFTATQKKAQPRGKHAISHKLKVCVALRYFATGANYSTIADVHGVSKSSVTRSVQAVSKYFRSHLREYVEWPKSEMQKLCKSMPFYQKTKKPRCCGLIDGTHIPISCPKGLVRDENQYYCYKGYYSINAMIVCDFDGIITHVNAANPGSCNDIYVMNGSQISHLGDRGHFKGYYLLGDSGYVLTDYVLTPVKLEENRMHVNYNRWHRSTRSRVERCIGVLKQRWRCMDSSGGHMIHSPEQAAMIIESCVCLHNCAKAGKVRLMRDSMGKDRFKRIRPPVVQPDNLGREPRIVFKDLRSDFIQDYFGPGRH